MSPRLGKSGHNCHNASAMYDTGSAGNIITRQLIHNTEKGSDTTLCKTRRTLTAWGWQRTGRCNPPLIIRISSKLGVSFALAYAKISFAKIVNLVGGVIRVQKCSSLAAAQHGAAVYTVYPWHR